MAQLQDKAAVPSSVMPEVRGGRRVRLADEVHHIVPIESVSDVKSMEMLAFDDTNLMSVCRECHHAIHNEMQSLLRNRFGRTEKED